MSTLLELRTAVSRALRDPNSWTFTVADVDDLINEAITEVGDFYPRRFQEDIEPDGSLTYSLTTANSDPRIRLTRVEIWSVSPDAIRMLESIPSAAGSLLNNGDTGWRFWNGQLELPYRYAAYLADDTKNLRVWGYAPYAQLVEESDESDLDIRAEAAAKEYAILQGYTRLANQRSLFTQYQTSSNATDITFSGVLNAVATYTQKWERRRRQLSIILELPD